MKILVDKMPEGVDKCFFNRSCPEALCKLYFEGGCPYLEELNPEELTDVLKENDKRILKLEQRTRMTQSKADRLENELKVMAKI